MAIEPKQIVEEALALLNEVGIDKLSTRRLAERLGVAQPALYWHFKSKSLLLDAVNSAMVARFHTARTPKADQSWEDFTIDYARSMRSTLLSVRDGARLTAGTRPSATDFADAERTLELYVKAGFTAEEAFNISISITRYVVGYVLEEQGERERHDGDGVLEAENPMAEVAQFPLLYQALLPLLQQGTINTEQVFESGLHYMIEGMRSALKAKQAK